MGTPYLGGWKLTAMEWIGRNAVSIDFRADGWLSQDKRFQVYRNRTLVAVTRNTTERTITVPLDTSAGTAAPLRLIVVDPTDALVDYGHLLPWLPANQFCVTWLPPDPVPSDLTRFEIAMSTSPGAAYAASNIVGNVNYDATLASYHFQLPPFGASGDWEVAVIPRDDAIPSGNAGTAATVTIPAVVLPRDVVVQSDGSRGTASVSSGVLTVDFDYP